MRKFIGAMVLAVALLAQPAARAEPQGPKTIGEMMRACKNVHKDEISKEQLGQANYCLGMLAGISKLMLIIGNATDLSKTQKQAVGMCTTRFTSYGQMSQAFINLAQATPASWQENGALGVIRALRETWPCK